MQSSSVVFPAPDGPKRMVIPAANSQAKSRVNPWLSRGKDLRILTESDRAVSECGVLSFKGLCRLSPPLKPELSGLSDLQDHKRPSHRWLWVGHGF